MLIPINTYSLDKDLGVLGDFVSTTRDAPKGPEVDEINFTRSFAGSTVRKVTRGMWALDVLNDTVFVALSAISGFAVVAFTDYFIFFDDDAADSWVRCGGEEAELC